MALDTFGSILQESEREVLNSLSKFVDQLPLVMSEVTQGVSEFKPTPSENRDCFKTSYNVKHTLLVKFNSDTIDETNIVEETLKPRVESFGGTVEKVGLSGNHITPCIQLYTPADAVAQRLKSLSLSDIRILATTISDWFKRFED
ncbi:eukaryotic initiation factor 4F subunit P150-like [Trifolium medium]|uniref:Eukaryotic initiation factor 4F subunit P150-like n=1 Tax=Trifolium medium TaxID=97028 RepID=A0A392MWS8_9FABA|nr:eukaryotic initiation factor 4F subunit P150-like [Trifolium medium]